MIDLLRSVSFDAITISPFHTMGVKDDPGMSPLSTPICDAPIINTSPIDDGQQPCVRCGFHGCDIRLSACGCSFHARCIPLPIVGVLGKCPRCNRPGGITLVPMSFYELDEAKRSAAHENNNGKRGKKRKISSKDNNNDQSECDVGGDDCDQRTGRWTAEETAFVEVLIAEFEGGRLPLVDDTKLNDFLAGMLQCKQSRLTKKMKNAKLSARTFKRTGWQENQNMAQNFSQLEEAFFQSIHSRQERAEMRFHMQKMWREHFSTFSVTKGQILDADAWLDSVEQMERRVSIAKDSARMTRRKIMMGLALDHDVKNSEDGVFIGRRQTNSSMAHSVSCGAVEVRSIAVNNKAAGFDPDSDEFLSLLTENPFQDESPQGVPQSKNGAVHTSERIVSSFFVDKVMLCFQKTGVPFEHIDAWVPSIVANGAQKDIPKTNSIKTNCRLSHAGSATADFQVGQNGEMELLESTEHNNLVSFGEYSQKFSFDVGCGLPGRVYQSGIPTWEQSVQNAPANHFERCGGAIQWGVKTVVAIPVLSPNVGRIVVILYSCHDRPKDESLVSRISELFTKLLPSPRWVLVVDVAEPSPDTVSTSASTSTISTTNTAQNQTQHAMSEGQNDARIKEVLSVLGEHMPSDASSPLSPYLQGFMSLRLMLLKSSLAKPELELVETMLSSYTSYASSGRSSRDIAMLLARDCMFLMQQPNLN